MIPLLGLSNIEQHMSLFGQILWLGPLSIDISLSLFRILFHVLIEFEIADREIIEKLLEKKCWLGLK